MTPEQQTALNLQEQGYTRAQIASQMGISEHAVKRRLAGARKWLDGDKEITGTASSLGVTDPRSLRLYWDKNHELPDGRVVTALINNTDTEEQIQERIDAIEERFKGSCPVLFTPPKVSSSGRVKKAFISISDLHSGALAWGKETGYGDWDLDIAIKRLNEWLSRLYAHIEREKVHEIILYYNGDTLHANGQTPMTSTHGSDHILDVDTRHFKTVDVTGENIISNTDMAAQVSNVRLVIKRGNHDGDSHLALLQGAKWRYYNQENVTVEMDPNAYWAHIFGRVALFGHHGDKIKPDVMIMQFLQRYRSEIADVDHITVWTGDKHHRKVEQFPGVTWEQSSCWSEPDLYGSKWGNNAMAQAVIYDEIEGEVARFTVKPQRNAT